MPLDRTYESIIKLNIELSISKVSVKTGYHSKYRNICGSIEPCMPPSRFVTGRRFFNTDRPSDFVPMAFIIYTCARYPQTQARAHNRASIDEEKFVEAENKKKKKKKKKEGDRREESEITSRLGDRTFLFLFLFFFRSMMLFTATTIEPVGNWSGRIEENFHDPRQPLQLDDVPFFFFYSFKSTWKTYNRRTYCIFQNQSEFGFSFAKCFAM